MRIRHYQQEAHKTSLGTVFCYGGDGLVAKLVYPTLKLAGEAGEFAEKVGKIIRDGGGVLDTPDRARLSAELGDILWYAAEIATVLGLSLENIAEANLEKLRSRQRRGVIHGSGDDR